MDTYLELGLRPFLELGFMPSKLGSGTQTVFYWKGNVTPPADDLEWGLLVENTLKHLAARYGAQEVAQWPVEVWNEPNLPGFWSTPTVTDIFICMTSPPGLYAAPCPVSVSAGLPYAEAIPACPGLMRS
jgi:xylan 1,4-beta-xylosidase